MEIARLGMELEWEPQKELQCVVIFTGLSVATGFSLFSVRSLGSIMKQILSEHSPCACGGMKRSAGCNEKYWHQTVM